MAVHVKCRNVIYLDGPQRFPVPDELVGWQTVWPAYAPVDYTSKKVTSMPPWADDERKLREFKFNEIEGLVNRTSFEGQYAIDAHARPINPKGRTGICGRGLLGRFGPNHAADPIVTRFLRDAAGVIVRNPEGHPMLECVLIKRQDTGQWALPGGMVEAGDTVSLTLKKEFGEEAMNSIEASEEKRTEIMASLDTLFAHGTVIYKGYVDDPRNTDNSWMETVAMNFHDANGTVFGAIQLHAGDDAGEVMWVTLDPAMQLYASHADFIARVIDLHWGKCPAMPKEAAPKQCLVVQFTWV